MSTPQTGNFDFLALAKGFTTPGPILLSTWGVYGGQYAKAFIAPFDWYASMICVGAMGLGVVFVVARLAQEAYQQLKAS